MADSDAVWIYIVYFVEFQKNDQGFWIRKPVGDEDENLTTLLVPKSILFDDLCKRVKEELKIDSKVYDLEMRCECPVPSKYPEKPMMIDCDNRVRWFMAHFDKTKLNVSFKEKSVEIQEANGAKSHASGGSHSHEGLQGSHNVVIPQILPKEMQKVKLQTHNAVTIDAIGSDILENILSRLPAKCFAYAACVNQTWSSVCSRILSSPKLTSAISLNPSFDAAVNEVIEKVLSVPIRPQFAVACVGVSSDLSLAHRLITERLGFTVPVVTSMSDGIIGRDALTNEFREVQWEEDFDFDEDFNDSEYLVYYEDIDDYGDLLNFGNVSDSKNVLNSGISLTLGYLPGLKVNLIPLTSKSKGQQETLFVDEFVTNILEYASSVSASASPDAIMLFTNRKTNEKPILQKMDYAFPSETIIVGDCGIGVEYRSNWVGRSKRKEDIIPAVALVFVKDRDSKAGIGETKFFAALSSGMKPIGPTYKAASVNELHKEDSTLLTARRESVNESLDGRTILDNISNEIRGQALYLGVKKRRKCTIGKEKVRWLTFLEFHEVFGGDEQYLCVNHTGIKTGDPIQFYISDIDTARSSCNVISETFKLLKPNGGSSSDFPGGSSSSSSKPVVYGGFVFPHHDRGEMFFDHKKGVDSMPFLEDFPGATLAGIMGNGEIIRGKSDLPGGEEYKNCFYHVYSTVYLLLSYIPVHPRPV